MIAVPRGKTASSVHTVAARKRFGRYKDEKEHAARELKVKDGEVSRIFELWNSIDLEGGNAIKELWDCSWGKKEVPEHSFSAEDITRFCIAVSAREEAFMRPDGSTNELASEILGMFLSYLIRFGKDDSYYIPTKHLDFHIIGLGYRNRKELVVDGDAGKDIGYAMEEGTIHVKGDVHERLGGIGGGKLLVDGNVYGPHGNDMNGGTVIVRGNVHGGVGFHMAGGRIEVKGNAENLGLFMTGGEIHIEGDFESIGTSRPKEAKINLLWGISTCGILGGMGAYAASFGGWSLATLCLGVSGALAAVLATRLPHTIREIRNQEGVRGGKIYHKGKLIVDK